MRVIAIFLAVFMLVGCNTMQGLGKDIKEGGEKLENSAK
ncbi:MAG TPA: entericidin A/B family lipoprotein [Gallionella sp.]|nr:entericidin A/B family lipoprotein [Gallionella sp.]